MLTITPTASDAIRLLVDNSEAPPSAGIRIAAGEPADQGTPLELALVEGPEPGDEVVSGNEATIFLEPQVAEYLEDTVLDAQVDGDQVQFALRESEPPRGRGPQQRRRSSPVGLLVAAGPGRLLWLGRFLHR